MAISDGMATFVVVRRACGTLRRSRRRMYPGVQRLAKACHDCRDAPSGMGKHGRNGATHDGGREL